MNFIVKICVLFVCLIFKKKVKQKEFITLPTIRNFFEYFSEFFDFLKLK